MIAYRMADRTVIDVTPDVRERLRSAISEAHRIAREEDLEFLEYLLEMALVEAQRNERN